MQLTMPTRRLAKRAAHVAVVCVAVMGLAPLLPYIDPVSRDSTFDGPGRDIGVVNGVADGLTAASPDRNRAGWIRLSDYRQPGTKSAKKAAAKRNSGQEK
jgi:hypothetical protein